MVRLTPDQPRRSTTTRRGDLPERAPGRRAVDPAAAVLRAVLDHGPVARSNLARLTGTSAASVSGVGSALLAAGLIREAPEAAGPPGFGRPHVPLDVDAEAHVVIGVHFAVPQATVAAVDLRGRVLATRRLPYDGPDPVAAVAAVSREVRTLAERYADRRVHGVGAAIGGWVDEEGGALVEHAMLGWRDVPLQQLLAAGTGLPAYVENHGRALLRAEQLFGARAEQARESILHLFVGHVVDGAFALQGQVHQGRRSASGTLAHLPVDVDPETTDTCECGRQGCLQAAVSERVLLRRAAELGLPARDACVLASRARAGDERVLGLFVERSRVVGHALACLLDLLSPEVVTLTEAGYLWVPQAREALLAEVAARSRTVADPAEVIAPPSFADFLPVAGASVLLDRLYAAPLVLAGALPSAS